MAGISLQNNLTALNANRMLGLNASSRAKSTEKLSSGYKINRAADDAAGLAISEKMRKLIRGLNQGTRNAQDGVSWVQIGDGALEEAQDMLKRMTELTIKSLNGTNSSSDRAALEAEFEQLKVEVDRISKTTEFNEMNIFSEHKPLWHRCNGNVKWEPNQMHVVTAGQNDLSFMYRETEGSEPQIMTITVPPGEYSTMELLDEIDDAISYSMGDSIRFFVEYNKNGYIDATLEGGAMLDSVFGGLSYLLYDMYKGGTMGALIGTTIFSSETARLDIVSGKNDSMSFTIEYFDGRTEQKSVSLSAGRYTRSELIDLINAQLTGTSVEASAYGTGIKLGSYDAIVTGFKGNMFRIDGADYTSVFYDNVRYGSVSQYSAVFQGGYVMNTDSRDVEHAKIKITDDNNVLTLQPNRRETPIDLVIDKGEYTMDELKEKLNALFKANNLELKASVISKYDSVGDKQVPFQGLEISSEIKGPDSLVNVDQNCSAFNTLFVNRNYNEYGDKAQTQNETSADKDAWFRGSKDLTVPLTLSQGNDTFQITFKNTDTASASTVTIRLTDKTYTSITDLITEINDKIAADSTCSGKLSAREESGRIRIDGAAGQDIDSVVVQAYNNDNGFETLFQGYIVNVYDTVQSGSSIVLDGTASSDYMIINVDGQSHRVQFPSSNPTQDEIKQAIENTIQAKDVTSPNTFHTVSASGSSSDRNFPASGSGSSDVTSWSDTKTGSSQKIEGMVGFEYNYPASMELGPQLRDQMVINSGNNTILLTVTEEGIPITKAITIPSGTYNQQTLENMLQRKVDEAFGADKGVVVTRNGNKLTLTSRLPEGADGGRTSITCGTADSSFLRWLNTNETPAVCTSSAALAPSIVIGADQNQFSFQYTVNGRTQNISLTLNAGSYTPASIVTQIQTQLNKTGTGIQASLSSSGQLVLTSSAVGSGVSILYHTSTAGNAMEALYGPLIGDSPANIVVPRDIQNSITIPAGGQDFSIVVNNRKETVTLDGGTYNRSQFLTMLNSKLSSIKVEAYLSGNRLGFRTMDKGPGISLKMEYAAGGSSMGAIYGSTTTTIPGVKAEWVNDSLKLTAVDTNGNEMKDKKVTVSSQNGGGLQPPRVVTTKRPLAVSAGYHSRKYSKVDGANLGEPISIDQWNNELNFRFTENGVPKDISIVVDDKNAYTYTELMNELQGKIDTAVGTGKIKVTVDQGGVVFTAVNKSSQYQFSNLSGDFYQNVMCSCTKKSTTQAVNNKDGSQIVNKAYVVGRKDIKTQPVEINKGVSDELSLDLTYAGTVHKIQVTLDPGRYSSEAIKQHLQQKIDEKLVEMGMKAGLIQVGVGGVSSGVAGGNDQKALNFSLSEYVTAPGEGDYIIDGVSGNAAFELFYQTDGKNIPSYIMGTKDVTNGVMVKPGETELSVCVDGTVYSMELREGPYTADELIDELNDKLRGANAPLAAYVDFDTGRVKLAHKMMDAHDISWVSGSAKDEIFFEEAGNIDEVERRVQLSDENPDYIELKRSEFSASLMGIQSLCITKIKYATKAVDRLSSALEKVSALRSTFGSTQNRLEHSIDNNRNKAENLQSAESLIRDTDMAKEMVRQASFQILYQAGISVLTQANQSREMILGLLQ